MIRFLTRARAGLRDGCRGLAASVLVWVTVAPAVQAEAPATVDPKARSTAFGSMPSIVEFLPSPTAAATSEPRDCDGRGIRSDPADLWKRDETAGRAARLLTDWGRRHFKFSGPALCVDFDFVMRQWQATVGMPDTGVLSRADADRFQAELLKAQPEFQAATAEWTRRRVESRAAGIDPTTGGPVVQRGAEPTGNAPFVPAGPSGPPEYQVFGLSLGAVLAAQRPLCKSGFTGIQTDANCMHRLAYKGRTDADYMLEIERVIAIPDEASEAGAMPDPNGMATIAFATADRPGMLEANTAMRAVLHQNRFEGVGFFPRDKAAVLEAFTARYGPAEVIPVLMRNSKGATWMGRHYRFRRGDVTATLNCTGFESSDCSYAQVITDRGLAALEDLHRLDTQRGVSF
jgi:hypothetical protein